MKDFKDKMKMFKRGPQVILPKDIGLIITEAGIGKDSDVLEAGTGSGMLTCYLANICKNVITYEHRKDFHNLAKHNFKNLGFKNIKSINDDVIKAKEKDMDVMILDLPNPQDYIKTVKKCLKSRGILVCYLPNITQIQTLIGSLGQDFDLIKITELMRRDWTFEDKIVRPKSKMIGHTAFLVFIRKK